MGYNYKIDSRENSTFPCVLGNVGHAKTEKLGVVIVTKQRKKLCIQIGKKSGALYFYTCGDEMCLKNRSR